MYKYNIRGSVGLHIAQTTGTPLREGKGENKTLQLIIMYKGVLNRDKITRCGSMLLVFPLSVDHCPCTKSQGGTLVTCTYIEESTYGWNIKSVCQKKSWFPWTGGARNRKVMMTFLLFVTSSTKWLGWSEDKLPKGPLR